MLECARTCQISELHAADRVRPQGTSKKNAGATSSNTHAVRRVHACIAAAQRSNKPEIETAILSTEPASFPIAAKLLTLRRRVSERREVAQPPQRMHKAQEQNGYSVP